MSVELKVRADLAEPGDYRMTYCGSTVVANKFGTESMEHVFSNGEVESTKLTRPDLRPGNSLGKLLKQLSGRKVAVGESYDFGTFVGREYEVRVVQQGTGAPYIESVSIMEGGDE